MARAKRIIVRRYQYGLKGPDVRTYTHEKKKRSKNTSNLVIGRHNLNCQR